MTDRIRVLFTRTFWLDATERAIKAAAGGASSLFTVGALPKVTLPWQAALVGTGLAALASLVLSIASAPVPAISPASVLPPGA